ncbi:MAG: hypothetical protein QF662_01215 [Phycisphaerae bacterium]|jgi:hypothetical protein|nr:hypothetical protein [Phycisphaerae bacterium]
MGGRFTHVRLTVWLAMLLIVSGCTPTLTTEQRIDLLLRQERLLREEIRQRDLRIAELSGTSSAKTRPQKPPAATPETDTFRAVAVRFNSHTGGVDIDSIPGDDQLKVILEPIDVEGDIVKRVGAVHLRMFAGNGNELEEIGQWKFTTLQMCRSWLTGPLGLYGYVLRLPLPNGMPAGQNAFTLTARFTTLDGRHLNARTTIEVDIAR